MRKILRWGLILGTLLLCFIILSDTIPLLRGPAPETPLWYWPYRLRPIGRWWWAIGAGIGMGGWGAAWMRVRPNISTKVGLLGLMGLHILLQLGIVYADATRVWLPADEAVLAELIDRTLPPLTSGYFWDAAHVDDMGQLLREFPQQMAVFESEHTRTHPPGLLLLNWLTLEGLGIRPNISTPISDYANSLRCTDLWLINSPPEISVGLIFWAMLPIFAASSSIAAAYYLAKALDYDKPTRRLAAALLTSLPALLVFAPKVDQLFVPLTLLLFAATVYLTKAEKPQFVRAFLLGFSLGSLVFLSIGNAALALPIGLILLGGSRGKSYSRDTVTCIIYRLLAVAVGGLLPWLIFWLFSGVAPWEIITTGLGQHYELVTTQRPYGVWVLWNLIDTLVFASPVVVVGVLVAGGLVWRERGRWQVWHLLAAALLLLLGLLDLSGSARGEVGRIWLFLFALLAVVAAEPIGRIFPRRHVPYLVTVLLALSIGLAWHTVRPVIVVTTPPVMAPFTPENVLDVGLSAEIALTGTTLSNDKNNLTVQLLWEAAGAADYPYTAFVHVTDAQGKLVVQQDNWPVAGQWPPTCWRGGDVISDSYILDIGALPGGSYQVAIGMYNRETSQRLGELIKIGAFKR